MLEAVVENLHACLCAQRGEIPILNVFGREGCAGADQQDAQHSYPPLTLLLGSVSCGPETLTDGSVMPWLPVGAGFGPLGRGDPGLRFQDGRGADGMTLVLLYGRLMTGTQPQLAVSV